MAVVAKHTAVRCSRSTSQSIIVIVAIATSLPNSWSSLCVSRHCCRLFGERLPSQHLGSLASGSLASRFPCGFRGAPFGLCVMAWTDREVVYRGFSWHTADKSAHQEASAVLAAVRASSKRSAIDWDGFLEIPDGFYLRWKQPRNYRAGYQFFNNHLGSLVSEPGQTSNWRVVGHRGEYGAAAPLAASSASPAPLASVSPLAAPTPAAADTPQALAMPAPSAASASAAMPAPSVASSSAAPSALASQTASASPASSAASSSAAAAASAKGVTFRKKWRDLPALAAPPASPARAPGHTGKRRRRHKQPREAPKFSQEQAGADESDQVADERDQVAGSTADAQVSADAPASAPVSASAPASAHTPASADAQVSADAPAPPQAPAAHAPASASLATASTLSTPPTEVPIQPSCACPVLLLRQRRQELEARRCNYHLGQVLGEGNFGRCFTARRLSDGREVAVKMLREGPDQERLAWSEAYLIDRCRGLPCFPQLLDVFMGPAPGQYSLVLEFAGTDLNSILQGCPCLPAASVPQLLGPLASALQFLHGLGLIHADVKPHNILVRQSCGNKWHAKLGDLGSVVESASVIRGRTKRQIQTLWWRAPEIIFGDEGFDQAVDVWSLGLVVAEIAGYRFQADLQETRASETGYIMALFRQLGTPDCPELTGLPLWRRQGPQFSRQPWPRTLRQCLGMPGVDLLDGMLSFRPVSRPTATQILESAFMAPTRFPLWSPRGFPAASPSHFPQEFGASDFFQGERHPWNICVGVVSPDVLAWLRADDALVPGTPAFESLNLGWVSERRNIKSEEGRKFILAGSLGECATSTMCGLSLATPLPLPRCQMWRRAFLAINARALAAMEREAKMRVQRLPSPHIGQNGDHFLGLPTHAWLASCGELVFVQPGSQQDGFWAEPLHMDGGASVMHWGLTLYGRRRLTCHQPHDLEDIHIENGPGTIYMGQLTGPRHQVTHMAAEPDELLELPGLGHCGVNIMMRTALFPYNRARLRDTTPSPQPFFEVLARCLREAMAQYAFRLPSLAECLAATQEDLVREGQHAA